MTWPGRARADPRKEINGIFVLASLIAVLAFGPAHTKHPGPAAVRSPVAVGRRHVHPRTTALVASSAQARAQPECSNSSPRACIVQAAERYHQSVADAERVAWCESRDEPGADNDQGDYGLYQFAAGTFAATVWGRGHPERIWSARYSALAAMWAWAQRPSWKDQWQCQ